MKSIANDISCVSWGPEDIYKISPAPSLLCGLVIQTSPIWFEIQDVRNLVKIKVGKIEDLGLYFPVYKKFKPEFLEVLRDRIGGLLDYLVQSGLYSYAAIRFGRGYYELRLPHESWLNKRGITRDDIYLAINSGADRS